MAMVTSTEAHAKVVKVDASAALKIPGVKGIVTHKDVVNNIHDGVEIIASDEVQFLFISHYKQLFRLQSIINSTKEKLFQGKYYVYGLV